MVTSDPTSEAPALAVCCDSDQPATLARARALAVRLDLPQAACVTRDYPLLLAVTDERIEVRQTNGTAGPVYSEFDVGRFGHRRTLPLRRELLARAVGFKGRTLDIVDMTAGMGRDAMVLALLGCRVTAVEAHPVVFALLEDGVRRAQRNAQIAHVIAQHLHLIQGDAADYLGALPPDARPDVVYLDPMFPPRTQSARAKKEMLLLARLLGSDAGATEVTRLLGAALGTGCRRVVVKRPRHSPQLVVPGGPPPSLRFEGRAARFDVYFPAGAPSAGPCKP